MHFVCWFQPQAESRNPASTGHRVLKAFGQAAGVGWLKIIEPTSSLLDELCKISHKPLFIVILRILAGNRTATLAASDVSASQSHRIRVLPEICIQ